MKISFIDTVHEALENSLTLNGYSCFNHTQLSREELISIIKDFDGIVIRSRFRLDEEFLQHAKNLKFIARSGAGMENIDLDYCKQRNIVCFNSPEGNADAVGEHAIGMLLSLFNHLSRCDEQVRKGIWDREGNRGVELAGKTVGIIGYGNMGSSFANKLKGFNCRIIAHDKYKSKFGNEFVEEVSLEQLKQDADIISLHLPISEETVDYVNENFISSVKKNFYLVNTARGKNVNSSDLVEALKNGKVLGACLDVLEFEKSSFENLEIEKLPESFRYLIQSEKVLLSPHVAGWTMESYQKLSSFLAEKIIAKFGTFSA